MTTTASQAKALLARAEDLEPTHRRLLELLALIFTDCTRANLMTITRLAGLKSATGHAYSYPRLEPELDLLAEQGLIEWDGTYALCSPAISMQLVLSLAEGDRETFQRRVDAIRQEMPLTTHAWSRNLHSFDRAVREARFAIALEDDEALQDILTTVNDEFPGAVQGRSLIELILGSLDKQEVLSQVAATVFERLAFLDLVEGQQRAIDTSPTVDAIEGRLADRPHSTPLRWILIDHLILRGERERARALIIDDGKVPTLTSQALLALVEGDLETARATYERALTALKKNTRRRKIAFPTTSGLFYPLLLLRQENLGDLKTAQQYLEATANTGLDAVESCIVVVLREVISSLMGIRSNFFDLVLKTRRSAIFEDSIVTLFVTLSSYWIHGDLNSSLKTGIIKRLEELRSSGYLWLAAELTETLARTKQSKSSKDLTKKIARELRDQVGGRPLVDLVVRKQPWERDLELLASIGAPATPPPDSSPDEPPSSRLTWRLALSNDTVMWIEPYEQKQTKKGGWTKGRKVAVERLATDDNAPDNLTAQDRRICEAIDSWAEAGGYGRYYGHQIVYNINIEDALPEMVGHPAVFLRDDPSQRIEVVARQPEILVRKTKDGYRLSFYPERYRQFEDQRVIGYRADDGRVEVITLTAEQERIHELVGSKGMKIPKTGQDKLAETIGRLSSLITVRSDIAAEAAGAEQVEAETTPRARLTPAGGEGLRVDLTVRPLGAGTPASVPGQGAPMVLAEVEGRQVQATRDLEAERQRVEAVLDRCPGLGEPSGRLQWTLETPEACLQAMIELEDLGDEVVLEWPEGQPFTLRGRPDASQLRLTVKSKDDWFSATGKLAVDDELVLDLRQLLELIEQSPGRFIELGQGQFALLTERFRSVLSELAAVSERKGKGVRLHPLATGSLEALLEEAGRKKTDATWKAHLERLEEARTLQPTVPSTLKAELRPYQEEGYRWLARLAHWGVGACLADDMGLGKTVQALVLLVDRAQKGPALVVAPTSVCPTWLDETRRFAPTLRPALFGKGDRQKHLDEAGSFDVVLCSYGLLQTESERLSAVRWSTVVLDEAQAIKNPTTKRAQAARKLAADARVITTGTPVENRLDELWSLFRFLNPGLLGSRERFNKRFAGPIEAAGDREARRHLRRLVRPFILRRTKGQVLPELPERTEIIRPVELGAEEAALYEALRQRALERLDESADDESAGARHLHILAELTRLRRACCHPRLVLPEATVAGAKLEALVEIVEELREGGHKALIFSQFVDNLTIIRARLDELGVSYQYLDGSTPQKQRHQRVNAFQAGEGDLFLISLKAGGTGLNLTAADYVIHTDPWWNPAVEDQGSDRAHRIGQERPVTIYKLVTRGTIEEKIVALHQDKRELAQGVLSGAEQVAQVDAAQLLALIRGEDGPD